MKIKFIKNHPKGYKAGREMELPQNTANRLIEAGYAVAEGLEPEAKPEKKAKAKK